MPASRPFHVPPRAQWQRRSPAWGLCSSTPGPCTWRAVLTCLRSPCIRASESAANGPLKPNICRSMSSHVSPSTLRACAAVWLLVADLRMRVRHSKANGVGCRVIFDMFGKRRCEPAVCDCSDNPGPARTPGADVSLLTTCSEHAEDCGQRRATEGPTSISCRHVWPQFLPPGTLQRDCHPEWFDLA